MSMLLLHGLTLSGKGWEKVLAEAEDRFIWVGLGSSLRHTLQVPWPCPRVEWENTPAWPGPRHIPSPRFIKKRTMWPDSHQSCQYSKEVLTLHTHGQRPLRETPSKAQHSLRSCPSSSQAHLLGHLALTPELTSSCVGTRLLTLLPSRRRAKWESTGAKAALSRPKDGHSFSQ